MRRLGNVCYSIAGLCVVSYLYDFNWIYQSKLTNKYLKNPKILNEIRYKIQDYDILWGREILNYIEICDDKNYIIA